ncbi:hypothetical protein KDJ56_01030 [Brevibacillus composti]|uniref:Uncharacterized protein n=1 Tax=Brevibacillus composti TaxID=2796470 RepID=A0A7T5EL91_9BACL|nr:hypothetical protein [Brevibacillus composti]QQE74622.1 hypothetical protein JD108_01030 [Brevibacillus composti]QUO41705.1 hypothetical protein KDJ56_01030 [Brevibacillus composti]
MKKLISFLLSCSLLVMAASTSIFAKEKTIPEEIILYETEMKSEQELIKDALTGKKDSGLKVHIKSEVINDNGKRQYKS